MMKEQMLKQNKYNEILLKNNINQNQSQSIDPMKKLNEMNTVINELLTENSQLKDTIKYLEDKIKTIILEKIEEKKEKEKLIKTDNTVNSDNTFNVKIVSE